MDAPGWKESIRRAAVAQVRSEVTTRGQFALPASALARSFAGRIVVGPEPTDDRFDPRWSGRTTRASDPINVRSARAPFVKKSDEPGANEAITTQNPEKNQNRIANKPGGDWERAVGDKSPAAEPVRGFARASRIIGRPFHPSLFVIGTSNRTSGIRLSAASPQPTLDLAKKMTNRHAKPTSAESTPDILRRLTKLTRKGSREEK